MVRYLRLICKRYYNEYYLKTVLSEYYKILGDKEECLIYAQEAFAQEPYDPLVKYDYAVALMLNGKTDEALAQFEEIVALGVDYIAFSEHGEGIKWAKKLLRDTNTIYSKSSIVNKIYSDFGSIHLFLNRAGFGPSILRKRIEALSYYNRGLIAARLNLCVIMKGYHRNAKEARA
jgi:tetratricopeptide (TPR) repeat protein